jgi:hypothetical protein
MQDTIVSTDAARAICVKAGPLGNRNKKIPGEAECLARDRTQTKDA